MKFTKKQKELLKTIGVPEEDFGQIERAAAKTTYSIEKIGYAGVRAGRKDVIAEIGEKAFLSGLARSAFHRTAGRPIERGGRYFGSVYFDSGRFFDEKNFE